MGTILHFCLVAEVKSLQFYLKHFQEEGICSIDDSFDYSSIDESIFRNVINYPTSSCQIISVMDTRPIPPPSMKYSLKDLLSDRASNYSDLNSDSSSLALTREEYDSLLDPIHINYSSSSENHGISSPVFSSFTSKEDLTSYLSSTKINFELSIFEHNLLSVISDLDSVNIYDCEDSLYD